MRRRRVWRRWRSAVLICTALACGAAALVWAVETIADRLETTTMACARTLG